MAVGTKYMGTDFGGYVGGVLKPLSDAKVKVQCDHAVTGLGWGVDGGTKYWLISNSHGAHWGEGGHLRLDFFFCRKYCLLLLRRRRPPSFVCGWGEGLHGPRVSELEQKEDIGDWSVDQMPFCGGAITI